jgi:hypothetical protein
VLAALPRRSSKSGARSPGSLLVATAVGGAGDGGELESPHASPMTAPGTTRSVWDESSAATAAAAAARMVSPPSTAWGTDMHGSPPPMPSSTSLSDLYATAGANVSAAAVLGGRPRTASSSSTATQGRSRAGSSSAGGGSSFPNSGGGTSTTTAGGGPGAGPRGRTGATAVGSRARSSGLLTATVAASASSATTSGGTPPADKSTGTGSTGSSPDASGPSSSGGGGSGSPSRRASRTLVPTPAPAVPTTVAPAEVTVAPVPVWYDAALALGVPVGSQDGSPAAGAETADAMISSLSPLALFAPGGSGGSTTDGLYILGGEDPGPPAWVGASSEDAVFGGTTNGYP